MISLRRLACQLPRCMRMCTTNSTPARTGLTSKPPVEAEPMAILKSTAPSPSVLQQILDMVKRSFALKAGATVVAVGLSALAYHGYFHESESGITKSMVDVFVNGGVQDWETHYQDADQEAIVDRPDLQKDLLELIRPTTSRNYVLIVGENGTGKSTAIRQCLATVKKPVGIVYFIAPEIRSQIGHDLAQAVGYRESVDFPARIRRWMSGITKEEAESKLSEEPLHTWAKIETKLRDVARDYYKRHHAPAVLIIDGADLIAKANPELFKILQEGAKKGADKGLGFRV